MTENEAIEEFKQRLELIEKCYRGEVEDYKQALELGVKALEKQMPKKPIKIRGSYFGKGKGGDCPNCKAGVNSIEYKYCRICGQALDWSDTE